MPSSVPITLRRTADWSPLVDAEPVVDDVVLDERSRAAAPDLDAQPFAAGAADAVVADDQLGRVVAEDAAPAGVVDHVAEHLVPYRAPGQADAAAVLGLQADVLDPAVGDAAVGHAAFHASGCGRRRGCACGPQVSALQVADRQVVEPEPPRVAAADALVDQRIVLAVERHVGDLHVLAAAEADEDAGLGALVDQPRLVLPGAEQLDPRLGPDRLGQLERALRQADGVARCSLSNGGGDAVGAESLGLNDR